MVWAQLHFSLMSQCIEFWTHCSLLICRDQWKFTPTKDYLKCSKSYEHPELSGQPQGAYSWANYERQMVTNLASAWTHAVPIFYFKFSSPVLIQKLSSQMSWTNQKCSCNVKKEKKNTPHFFKQHLLKKDIWLLSLILGSLNELFQTIYKTLCLKADWGLK